MNQKRLDRINELARKQKTIGRGQLENISFVEADGSITPLSSLRKKDI